MFSKRPSELTPADIERAVAETWQENDQLELKVALPSAGKKVDPWEEGRDQIGNYGRDKLLAELIAFANAHGGWLLLGIAEINDKPARAGSIHPVRDCIGLAERLKLQCRDCIEPQLPVVEVAGVPVKDDGAGVVAVYVPPSRSAPHRSASTKECYYRRADRTEKMTMREIQDLTLQTERGMAGVEMALDRRRRSFGKWFDSHSGMEGRSYGFRATLAPTTPVFIENVHNNGAVQPEFIIFRASFENARESYELQAPRSTLDWRPILRGSRGSTAGSRYMSEREVHCDGTIEYRFFRKADEHSYVLYAGWVMGLASNALCAAERFRQAASASSVEYALDLEVVVFGECPPIGVYGSSSLNEVCGSFPSGNTAFPHYSVGQREEFADLMALVDRDFWNAAGIDGGGKLHVDFDSAFRQLGIVPEDRPIE